MHAMPGMMRVATVNVAARLRQGNTGHGVIKIPFFPLHTAPQTDILRQN